jgi:hypothetical protein
MHTSLIIQLMDQLPLHTFQRYMARYPTCHATPLCSFLRPTTENIEVPGGSHLALPSLIGDLVY